MFNSTLAIVETPRRRRHFRGMILSSFGDDVKSGYLAQLFVRPYLQ
jgi:hypothetical protein